MVGSEACPISASKTVTITFNGDANSPSMGVDPFDNTQLGTKGLAVLHGGDLQLWGGLGSPVSWTRLAVTAQAGDTTITVEDDVSAWPLQGSIFLAATGRLAAVGHVGDEVVREFYDEVSITSIDATGRVLTVSQPLAWEHFAEGQFRGEVGLLTRNIVLQGDAASDTSLFGGHIMIRKTQEAAVLSGVELFRMGQRHHLARYPIHFHVHGTGPNEDPSNWPGHLVQHTAVHHSHQRGYVVHETHGVTLYDNVGYKCVGHVFFLEDGAERYNIFRRNLAAHALKDRPNGASRDPAEWEVLSGGPDDQPAGFWIPAPMNYFEVPLPRPYAFFFFFQRRCIETIEIHTV